jgi:acetyl esterase/lipase
MTTVVQGAMATAGSVRVELPTTTSLATQLAPAVLTPVRWALQALVSVAKRSPVQSAKVFAVTGYTDVYAAPLVAPHGTRRLPMTLAERLRGEWLWHDEIAAAMRNKESAILYLHGGGFALCGLNTHRRLAARIGRAAGMPVFQIAYRQLPHRLTQSIEDCVDAYRYLLDQGVPAERILLAGDSAGGGLAFLLALACRERGLPMPAGIAALSPWADLDNTARRDHRNAGRDAYIPTEAFDILATWGFRINGTLDPAWSPAHRDLTGLPPVLIQVGSTEILMSDAEQLAARCADADVPCVLQIWDGAPHVFQVAADLLPEGRAAIGELGMFARRVVGSHTVVDSAAATSRSVA